jgi:acyl-CoA hydrolase
MIHKFINGEIVKVDDISFISTIKIDDFIESTAKYYVYLNNSVKIEQILESCVKKYRKYNRDLDDIEDVFSRTNTGEYIKIEKHTINKEKHPCFSMNNLESTKEFRENYLDLLQKFNHYNNYAEMQHLVEHI